MISFDRDRWLRALEEIAIALGKEGDPVEICLIGSAACLFGGMDGRTSRDLDVWQPASDYDMAELKAAVETAGLAFNPTSAIEPDMPYLQIVEPGIVQIGSFTPVKLLRIGRLRLTRPPIENIIAAKLTRCAEKDLADIRYLISQYQPDFELILKIIALFPNPASGNATANLVYLEIFQ